MSWLKSWWSIWTTGRDINEEIAKATKAAIDKEPMSPADMWAMSLSDPVIAASYLGGMNYAAGAHTHIHLTIRLIRELEQLKNDKRARKAPRTARTLQPRSRLKRGRP